MRRMLKRWLTILRYGPLRVAQAAEAVGWLKGYTHREEEKTP